ncbi:MAG TPA: GNAT family N-acetyltransferase [Acidimicrobiales bacterium]|nr:GNAT family N-acetyltransferase [Acidimicrobiales bacterium]
MPFALRAARPDDEPFLWAMLHEAAHAAEEGIADPSGLRAVPELARYVDGWGRPADLGVVGGDAVLLGAAWLRLLTGEEPGYGYVDDATPELAVAVAPEVRGAGLGTSLLTRLLDDAAERFDAVCLSVRGDNPARRLYERLGFVAMGEHEVADRGRNPLASVTMVRRLRHRA